MPTAAGSDVPAEGERGVRLILTDQQFPVYPDGHTTNSAHQLCPSLNSITHTETCAQKRTLAALPACLTLSQTMNHCTDASLADRSGLALPPPFMATQSSSPPAANPYQSTCER